MLVKITPMILEGLKDMTYKEPKDIYREIKSLLSCMESVQSVAIIGISQAYELSKLLSGYLNLVFARKLERSSLNSLALSTIETQGLEDAEKIDDQILQKTIEIIGKMLKSFKTQYSQIFIDLFKNVFGGLLYKNAASDAETLSAICIFCDYIEFTHDLLITNTSSPILDQFIKYCYHPNSDIRQSSVSGLGMIAEISPQFFRDHLENSLAAINYIITLPDSKSDSLIMSTESAIGALGKITIYHNPNLFETWLSLLPLKSDPEEAQSTHQLLIKNILNFPNHQAKIFSLIQEIKQMPYEYLTVESREILSNL